MLASKNMDTFLGGIIGFTLFTITSTHKSPVRKRMPYFRFKNVHFTPEIKLVLANHTIHFHHWMIFGSILIFCVMLTGIIRSDLITGFLSGSTIQGLTFGDRFVIIQRVIDQIDQASSQFFHVTPKAK